MPDTTKRSAADRGAQMLSWLTALLIASVFLHLTAQLVRSGASRLSWAFLWREPLNSGRAGGIGSILVATVFILLICLIVALPIGLGCAVWLQGAIHDTDQRGRRSLLRGLDLLASVPSIVFGLFGMTVFCHGLRLGYSVLAGGLTLACMVLPLLIRTTCDALRSVPPELRLAAEALGLSQTRTLLQIVLPVALPGLLVGLLLSLGRAASETAALIFTSGYVTRMPHSPLDSGRALSVHVYDLAMNVTGGEASAGASAVVLLSSLLMINLIAVRGAERWLRRVGSTPVTEGASL